MSVPAIEPTDADRYPVLSEHGQRMLEFLREHPHAPRFRNESGHRLTTDDLARVRAFFTEVESASVGWHAGELPPWLDDFVARTWEDVPACRRHGARPACFTDLPTTDRGDLGHDIAAYVPDSLPLDRVINFRTSGTSGHPLLIASHPTVAASYLAFHRRALHRFGIELRHGRGQVGVVLVGFQRRCFTYVSVTPTMDESGLVKLNLHPDDWRDPADRARYLDALAPEVFTGDPLSFAELMRLPLRTRPRALLSTSMTLLPGQRAALEAHFACPVLDLYSMNEAGPVAVFDPRAGGHVLLQHRLYVEVLDPTGRPVAPGERGEVTLTGGFNPWLPLVRYRTGDYATLRLDPAGGEPVLVGLEGRPPVRFCTRAGEWLNNIEITHALKDCALPRFTLHQDASGALVFRAVIGAAASDSAPSPATPPPALAAAGDALRALFGADQPLRLEVADAFGEKVIQYTTDLPDAAP